MKDTKLINTIHDITNILEHNAALNYNTETSKAAAERDGYTRACEDFNKALRGRLEETEKPITEILLKTYQNLKEEIADSSKNDDTQENYSNGYRWGHRNGQIELIERILDINTGGTESEEQVQ